MTETRGLLVLEPGLLTTVQDLGRYGWASFGVPVAGALDEEALRLANRLVGNAENAAALEITVVGPVLRAAGDLHLTVVGGAFGPSPGKVFRASDGEIVSLAAAPGETRAIAAVGGGIDVPLVLGSRSTCVSGRFGGFQGRRLQRGDFLPVFPPSAPPLVEGVADVAQPGDGVVVLRAFSGSDEGEFDAAARTAFWDTPWKILPESNRMGLEALGPFTRPRGNRLTRLRRDDPGHRPGDRRRAPHRAPRGEADDGRLSENRRRGGRRPRSPRADAAGPKRAL